jgi:hypothetical protein
MHDWEPKSNCSSEQEQYGNFKFRQEVKELSEYIVERAMQILQSDEKNDND